MTNVPKGKYCYTRQPKVKCKYLLNGFVCEKFNEVNAVFGVMGVLENTTKCSACLNSGKKEK